MKKDSVPAARILLVDDNARGSTARKMILVDHGYGVETALSGEEAWETFSKASIRCGGDRSAHGWNRWRGTDPADSRDGCACAHYSAVGVHRLFGTDDGILGSRRTDQQEQQGSSGAAARGPEAGRAPAAAKARLRGRRRTTIRKRSASADGAHRVAQAQPGTVCSWLIRVPLAPGPRQRPSRRLPQKKPPESRPRPASNPAIGVRSSHRCAMDEDDDPAGKDRAARRHRVQRTSDEHTHARVPEIRSPGFAGACRRPDSGQRFERADRGQGRSSGSRQFH